VPNLRHSLTLQTNTPAAGPGEATDSWANTATGVMAEIRPGRSREFMQARQANADVTHEVRIRYRSGVTTKQRLVFGTRNFYIEGIVNGLEEYPSTHERDQWLTLICREAI
jgi:SPP1 family predicted phage head-tail adaptor